MEEQEILFSKSVTNLLKGIINRSDDLEVWDYIIRHKPRIEEYVKYLNLKFVLDSENGYCYVTILDDSKDSRVPRLVRRNQLDRYSSLILVLLKKNLPNTISIKGQEVISKDKIYEYIALFLGKKTDEIREIKRVNSAIKKIADMGFIKQIKGYQDQYEILRIVERFVDAHCLEGIDTKLDSYREFFNEDEKEEE